MIKAIYQHLKEHGHINIDMDFLEYKGYKGSVEYSKTLRTVLTVISKPARLTV